MLKQAWFYYLLATFALGGGLLLLLRGWEASRSASVTLEWSTATETDTAGFNLFRSSDPLGEFSQINPNIIPASGEPLSGGEYRYEDEAVMAGQIYYYELEEVQNTGSRGRIGRQVIVARSGGLIEFILSGGLFLLGAVFLVISQLINTGRLLSSNRPVLE